MDKRPHFVEKPPRWRRWLVRLALAASVLALPLVCLAIGVQIWKSGWQREVNRQLAELRASGIPTTPAELEASYQLPPGVEDCTQLWLDATAPLAAAEKELKESGLPFLSSDAPDPPPPGEDWPQLAQAEALLARFQPSLDKMHEAARRGGAARYPTDFSKGYEMPLVYAHSIRLACRVLLLEAYINATSGETTATLESLDTCWRITQSLEPNPAIVTALIRVNVHPDIHRLFGHCLARLPFDESQLSAQQALLSDGDYRRQLIAIFQSERVLGMLAFDQPDSSFFEESGERIKWLHMVTGPKDRSYTLELLRVAENDLSRPWPEIVQSGSRHGATLKEVKQERDLSRLFTQIILPPLQGAVNAFARAAASRDATVCGLAAERFRLRHGEWPTTMADLTPDLLPEVPIDPFDGQPLRYRVDEDGLCVYSVGVNGVDDEGTDDPRHGDIVFRIPRRSYESSSATAE